MRKLTEMCAIDGNLRTIEYYVLIKSRYMPTITNCQLAIYTTHFEQIIFR